MSENPGAIAPSAAAFDAPAALALLRTMWRIRVFEERVGVLKRADEVYGLIQLSVGQEAVAAAVCTQLCADDAVYTGHRVHGQAIAKGAPLERILAEWMGRRDGLCHGLGGSMHLVDVEHSLMGATGGGWQHPSGRVHREQGALLQARGGERGSPAGPHRARPHAIHARSCRSISRRSWARRSGSGGS